MKVAVLSNTNIDALTRSLQRNYDIYKADGYNGWIQEILDMSSKLHDFDPDVVFIILDGQELVHENEDYEVVKEQIDQYLTYISEYADTRASCTKIFISSLDIPARRLQCLSEPRQEKVIECYWNSKIASLCSRNSNTYIIDIKSLVEAAGRQEFYSKKLWYMGGIRYSVKGQRIIEAAIHKHMLAAFGSRKKCIVLDLDNTLWGGVIGEAGLQGIELSDHKEGARYRDFQMRLKEMKAAGIILTVVSKNNYEDVIEVFKEHKGMYLKVEDFAAMRINWEPKAKSIKELAEALNIGLDSMVFIDDSPIEREAVRCQLPEVTVPDFPEDSADLEDFITNIYYEYFVTLDITEEDRKKTEQYKQNAQREKARKISASIEDYLLGLQTKIKIWKASESDADRIGQLVLKTNQFNLTAKRYTDKEIRSLIESEEYDVYVASVEDKFGDSGKTAVLVIRREAEQVEIDSFLMSCRIMGRFIEDMIIDFIERKYRYQGFKQITAAYLKTKKNLPVANLFERLGYVLLEQDEDGNKRYRLSLEMYTHKRKNYGELIEL